MSKTMTKTKTKKYEHIFQTAHIHNMKTKTNNEEKKKTNKLFLVNLQFVEKVINFQKMEYNICSEYNINRIILLTTQSVSICALYEYRVFF